MQESSFPFEPHTPPDSGEDPLNPGRMVEESLQLLRERRDLRKARCLDAVLGLAEGRILLYEIMREGGLYNRCATANEPFATAFNEGRRDFAIQLRDEIKAINPMMPSQMEREAEQEMIAFELEQERALTGDRNGHG